MTAQREHHFGGDWTSAKLEVLAKYLASYTKVLKSTKFRKAYIDAFAGTGYRMPSQPISDPARAERRVMLFEELRADEPQRLLEGSARLALQTRPRFDKYIFIEKHTERCAALEALRVEFPEMADDIDVRAGDANKHIRDLCAKNWKSRRAVLFLDPYGMQVEWQTIEAVAATQSIDLWLLFPLGVAVNRMLPASGRIRDEWKAPLTTMFGTEEWYDAFYKRRKNQTLFGEEEELEKVPVDAIGRYFVNRLNSLFPGVIDKPGVLRNSTNCPLYLLCFAASNERGAETALRIAGSLLKDLQ